ncbi:MAG: hypothetical protein JSR83_09125 [Proteobacteria bacterium]|nr:hypothetical protein [Pseudomonadota bacterium]
MKEFKLDQKQLAVVLDVPLHRVKSLTSGRVQKLTREESEALVTKLRINPEWLITGEEPMIEEETDREFSDRIQAINHMNAVVAALPLDELGRARLQALMTGDPAQDGPLIAKAMRGSYDSEKPIQTERSGNVTQFPVTESTGLLWRDLLVMAVDALHDAQLSLPGEKLAELVDLLMALQRAGAKLDKDTVTAQVRLVA